MGFVMFLIGVFGTAGAIETNHNPSIAIIIGVVGFLLMLNETRTNYREYRNDSRPRFMP